MIVYRFTWIVLSCSMLLDFRKFRILITVCVGKVQFGINFLLKIIGLIAFLFAGIRVHLVSRIWKLDLKHKYGQWVS